MDQMLYQFHRAVATCSRIPERAAAVLVVLGTLAGATRLTAQVQQGQNKNQVHYTLKVLASLGGTFSAAQGANNKGWITGDSNLPGDQTEHAVLWRNGVITDLGTLGGLSSAAGSVNERGFVTGASQTSTLDPLGEGWSGFTCTLSGGLCQGYQNLVRGFVWENGVMTSLPTLGGNNGTVGGFNGGVNNRGQVIGFAETATQDPNCVPPQVLDFEAVIWGPKAGEVHELPLLPGDLISGAEAINDHGQVVGGSGPICVSPSTAGSLHAVLWEKHSDVYGVVDLGNLGGVMNNVAWDINNRGQVVGFSDLAGDQTTHAFLWQRGVMTDLGTLPGDVASFAYNINDKGQVVGQSLDQSGNSRSFIWQEGVMTDLNTLIPPGSSLDLIQPYSINSEGEIVGQAFDQSSGAIVPFLAIPCDEKHGRAASCDDQAWSGIDAPGPSERPNVILPESVREQLRTRRGLGQFVQLGR